MSPVAVISLVISGLAFLFSIPAFIVSFCSYKLYSGEIEMIIRKTLSDARARLNEASKQYELNAKKTNAASYELAFLEAREDLLNTYDEICNKYLRGKVDRKYFEKTYKTEIVQLVKCDAFQQFFNTVSSEYESIIKAYKKMYKN